jgi:hypothetical protein
MNCRKARRLLSACLDRDLSFEEEERLRSHLRECLPCDDEMTCLENLQELLQGLPETDPGPGFYDAVCRRIEAAQAQPAVLGGRPRFALADALREAVASAWLRPAAGVALGLVVGLLINLGTGPAEDAPAVPAAGYQLASEMLSGDAASGSLTGPLADLDLSLRYGMSDSTLAGEELVLDPAALEYSDERFVTDDQGRLVRPPQVRRAVGDGDVDIVF